MDSGIRLVEMESEIVSLLGQKEYMHILSALRLKSFELGLLTILFCFHHSAMLLELV